MLFSMGSFRIGGDFHNFLAANVFFRMEANHGFFFFFSLSKIKQPFPNAMENLVANSGMDHGCIIVEQGIYYAYSGDQ